MGGIRTYVESYLGNSMGSNAENDNGEYYLSISKEDQPLGRLKNLRRHFEFSIL